MMAVSCKPTWHARCRLQYTQYTLGPLARRYALAIPIFRSADRQTSTSPMVLYNTQPTLDTGNRPHAVLPLDSLLLLAVVGLLCAQTDRCLDTVLVDTISMQRHRHGSTGRPVGYTTVHVYMGRQLIVRSPHYARARIKRGTSSSNASGSCDSSGASSNSGDRETQGRAFSLLTSREWRWAETVTQDRVAYGISGA